MKKVFIQFLQWILKHKKRVIYGALAFLIGQICFFDFNLIGIENEVFAAGEEGQIESQTINSVVTEKSQILSFVQKMICSLIYPFIVIAGTLVDNSLVYGEVFSIDVLLRNLWNMMRNLANYTLGFIFIYKIFEYLVGSQKSKDIKKFLIHLLIAGIGIQASWFIMATLIDISTILTYSVGSLPITILKGETTTGQEGNSDPYDPYVLKTIIHIDVDNVDKMSTYLTNTNTKGEKFYISECRTVITQGHELLLAPKIYYYKENNTTAPVLTMTGACHYGGQVYYFSSLYEGITIPSDLGDYAKSQGIYEANLVEVSKKIINDLTGNQVIDKIAAGILLEQGNAHITGGVRGALRTGRYADAKPGLDVNNEITGSGKTEKLHDVSTGKSYVGIFTHLYTSLMHAGEGVITNGGGEFSKLLGTALYLGHLIAIGIPLIVAGLVFMIRIGILWMAIVLSPFIAILTAFDDIGKAVHEKLKIEFLEYFKIENLLGIIFSPVVVCLAISLSTVLFTIITNLGTAVSSGLGGWKEVLGGAIKLNVEGIAIGAGRFVIAVLGIAITRFVLWTAVKLSKIGEIGIIKDIENLAKDSLSTIPIVPIPKKDGQGVDFVGTKAAFGSDRGGQSIFSKFTDNLDKEFSKTQNKAIDELLDPKKAAENAANVRGANEIQTYVNGLDINGPDWRQQTININGEAQNFNAFTPDQQKQIIDAINELDDDNKRAELGNKTPEITIGSEKWEFDTNKKKYEQKSNQTN